MNYTLINRVFGAVVFLISLIVLVMTVQPSTSFWDCGEFIAAAYSLQVPHPPGTPFFLFLGRIFSMVPFVENIGLRVNYISVLSGAITILFTYLIIVKLIMNFKKEHKNTFDAIITFVSASIGALAFSFSDTFWFNAVEAEVYSASTALLVMVMYYVMKWNEVAHERGNERYLILAAYLIGLSTGVHLMSVLAIVTVVMIVIFKKYLDDENHLKVTSYIFMGHAAVLVLFALIIWGAETATSAVSPEEFIKFDNTFKIGIVLISGLIMAVFWRKLFNRNSIYIPIIVGGIALFVTYPGVVKYLSKFMAAVAGQNIVMEIVLFFMILGGIGWGIYYSVKNQKATTHLILMSFLFILLGFTTYAMVIIRANQNPPMNENEPKTFPELVSYLGREQYGDFPTFKRRFSNEAHQQGIYFNYNSDLSFWWNYQMNHMMTRYMLWNFAGRESWNQDAGANIAPFNGIGNAFGKVFGIRFAGDVKDSLFGIPLLLGLIGIWVHFRRDWKMAAAFMILFILMGYLTAYYQNQQQPQPRERDYFYAGAYFVFAIWIGIAFRGLADIVSEKLKGKGAETAVITAILLLGVVFVPGRMLQANYFTHDRSKNWVPWDYAYNLLQSCEPNAILFTNGDNDTFPLWYLQDVEGVRRDVRVANLSLMNTTWYIRQLKEEAPYGTPVVTMSMNSEQIKNIRPVQYNPTRYKINVPESAFGEFTIKDSLTLANKFIEWDLPPAGQVQGGVTYLRIQDLVVRDIVLNNAFKRPIYFAITSSEDAKAGLSPYLELNGLAYKLVPYTATPGVEFLNEKFMRQSLFEENPGYSKDFKPGLKFRGLNDPTIFFDENHARLSVNYRGSFLRLALYYQQLKQNEKVREVIDEMEKKIPVGILPMDYLIKYNFAIISRDAGDFDRFAYYASSLELDLLSEIEKDPLQQNTRVNSYMLLLNIYEYTQQYDKAANLIDRMMTIYPAEAQGDLQFRKQRYIELRDNKNPVPDSLK
ncbi:MAG: DUF2723 domain-containing protein [Ignavibacteriaceae bacterium]|nr:DUF2723 domain-containing protein [Ignavibacteriaceae bacterium]